MQGRLRVVPISQMIAQSTTAPIRRAMTPSRRRTPTVPTPCPWRPKPCQSQSQSRYRPKPQHTSRPRETNHECLRTRWWIWMTTQGRSLWPTQPAQPKLRGRRRRRLVHHGATEWTLRFVRKITATQTDRPAIFRHQNVRPSEDGRANPPTPPTTQNNPVLLLCTLQRDRTATHRNRTHTTKDCQVLIVGEFEVSMVPPPIPSNFSPRSRHPHVGSRYPWQSQTCHCALSCTNCIDL